MCLAQPIFLSCCFLETGRDRETPSAGQRVGCDVVSEGSRAGSGRESTRKNRWNPPGRQIPHMHRDTKLGLALAILVMGFAAALCFPRVTPETVHGDLKLVTASELDAA